MAGSPKRWVALLRAINVGSRNKISMADLRDVFASTGAADVTTYVQSGNVLFSSAAKSAGELEAGVEAALERRHDLRVRVLVRSAAELRKVGRGNPFAADERDPTKLHVAFLASAPARTAVRALEAEDFAPDRLRVSGRAVYFHLPAGYGRSNLQNALLERRLGVAATTRNWRTVTKLVELSSG
jgi:uncharacterized protein (DUF1697 family)